MILISSPATEAGVVYKIHKGHYGPQGDPLILVVESDSKGLNPKLDQSRIDREYELDAEGAQSEWGGKFRSPVSIYLPRNLIEAAVEKGVGFRPRLPGVQYLAFTDIASGTGSDSSTMCIGHSSRDGTRDILIVDAIWEARPPFNALDVVKGHADALKAWGLSSVMGDDYGAGLVRNMYSREGIAYQSCPLTASELYLHSLAAWTSGIVSMLDNKRAIEQLAGLRRKVGQGGKESIIHLGRSHDDIANSIAGLLYRLTPLEQVGSIAELQGIGVFTQPRVHFGDPNTDSATDAFMRQQSGLYGRSRMDGGPIKTSPHLGLVR
jgi:hypothetical protein